MKENKPNTWIYDDGGKQHPCSTFPYAFRFMYNALKKWEETGHKYHDLAKRSRIIAPFGKIYNYDDAIDLAKASGLLQLDGNLNSKEFKKR